MLNRLTKQERVMLIVLVTIVIWAVGIFAVIRPSLAKRTEAISDFETAEAKKIEVDTKLASEKQLDNDISAAEKKMAEFLSVFFKPAENFDVDQYLFEKFEKNQLAINSFQVADAAVMPMEFYLYVAPVNSYPLGDYAKLNRLPAAEQTAQTTEATTDGEAAEGTESTEVTQESTAVVNESVEKQVVTVSFVGGYENVKAFAQTIADDSHSLTLTGLTLTQAEGGQWNGSVTLEYISVDYD